MDDGCLKRRANTHGSSNIIMPIIALVKLL